MLSWSPQRLIHFVLNAPVIHDERSCRREACTDLPALFRFRKSCRRRGDEAEALRGCPRPCVTGCSFRNAALGRPRWPSLLVVAACPPWWPGCSRGGSRCTPAGVPPKRGPRRQGHRVGCASLLLAFTASAPAHPARIVRQIHLPWAGSFSWNSVQNVDAEGRGRAAVGLMAADNGALRELSRFKASNLLPMISWLSPRAPATLDCRQVLSQRLPPRGASWSLMMSR